MTRLENALHLLDEPPTWLIVLEGVVLVVLLVLILFGLLPFDPFIA